MQSNAKRLSLAVDTRKLAHEQVGVKKEDDERDLDYGAVDGLESRWWGERRHRAIIPEALRVAQEFSAIRVPPQGSLAACALIGESRIDCEMVAVVHLAVQCRSADLLAGGVTFVAGPRERWV